MGKGTWGEIGDDLSQVVAVEWEDNHIATHTPSNHDDITHANVQTIIKTLNIFYYTLFFHLFFHLFIHASMSPSHPHHMPSTATWASVQDGFLPGTQGTMVYGDICSISF